MKRRYWKYEAGRWLGVMLMLGGCILLTGVGSNENIAAMMIMLLLDVLVITLGYVFYKLCKYKEMYLRAKRKGAQERQLQQAHESIID